MMASWVEDIVKALKNLGGQASLTQIYDEVKRIRTSPITPTFEATIRRELQSRSAESINFQGKTDLFRNIDKGVWGLKENTSQSETKPIIREKDGKFEETERKMVEDNGLFLGKEILNFSIEEPIETISNLFQTIKEYRDYAKVEDISKWFEYIHQVFHLFGFGIKPITNRLMTIQDIGENQTPKALVSIVGPNENFHEIAYEVTWDSYLFYAAKFYSLEWVILTNGLKFKVMNCAEDINKHKFYQCEFEEILKQGQVDSFFTIYKILNIINRNPNKTSGGGSNGKTTPKKPGERVLAARHLERKEFWTQLIERSKIKTKLFIKRSPGVENYFGITTGRKGVSYSCNLTYENARVEIYIDNGNKEWNKKAFDYFNQNREQIEKEIGNSLVWDRLEDNRASVIRFYISEKGLNNKEEWSEIQDAFIDNVLKIDKVFRPLIQKLPY